MWKIIKSNWQLVIIIIAIVVVALTETMKVIKPSNNEIISRIAKRQ